MFKKTLAVFMACALVTGSLITGCDRQTTVSEPIVRGERNGVINHGHSTLTGKASSYCGYQHTPCEPRSIYSQAESQERISGSS